MAAKALEFGVDERRMRLVGTYYMGHGHVVLRSKITCTEADSTSLEGAISTAIGMPATTIKVECGEKTALGGLVSNLNENHEMYDISTLVWPGSYHSPRHRMPFESGYEG